MQNVGGNVVITRINDLTEQLIFLLVEIVQLESFRRNCEVKRRWIQLTTEPLKFTGDPEQIIH